MIWKNLCGAVVDGRYRLETLTYSGRHQAEFQADAGEPATVTLLAAPPEEIEQLHSDLLAASRLAHPHLLRILGAGRWRVEETPLLYLATERADETLADALAAGPLSPDAATALLLDAITALEYVHGQGLVYRSLEPQTTVRVNKQWKLADRSELCPIGTAGTFAGASPYIPPEAGAEPAQPSWDVWALGALLRRAAGQPAPAPFEAIIESCLDPAPARRPALDRIRTMLLEGRGEGASLSPGWWRSAALFALAASMAAVVVVWNTRAPATGGAAAPRAAATEARALPRAPNPATPRLDRPSPMTPGPARAARTVGPEPQSTQAEVGIADYIASSMDGQRTASGELLDSGKLTAAHPGHPLGTRLRVTNLENQRSVIVRVNDRGAFHRGRILHLTERAARELGMTEKGSARVRVERIEE